MACCWCLRSAKPLLLLLVLAVPAVPLAYLVSLELAAPAGHVYLYHSANWLRECAKWDDPHRRFLVSAFSGGVSEVSVPEDHSPETVLEEVPLVKNVDLAGNSSLGLVVDRPRNRVLVVAADVTGNRYGALLAYDLSTWRRLFLAQLSGPNDEKSLADGVAVDAEGNAYVTDVIANKIWKVGVDGKVDSIIRSPLFTPKEWHNNLGGGLNGIVYHPRGFLLVVHTFTGDLFKIDLESGRGESRAVSVKRVGISARRKRWGVLNFADGMELLSPTKLVVAGNPSASVFESADGLWDTAYLAAVFHGPKHRMATAATVKDGRVYLNHLIGMGYPKRKHALVEAVFSSQSVM